ncbi:DUF3570 domain-containing protein [Bizionia myxarmorum]|uniref:DUF3570 domain-containing protein n=1 Tax=Bizionia myxarmorum TaxID=291186 RepID=A0A5D0QYJ2_9FLAO|nr:DUF3570 domain-containing protein [Bizionia myxarmorum]TYB74272.1 DUF3570 domain-containing protein [Bizionia myxarmorum]
MKKIIIIAIFLVVGKITAQQDSTKVYKKRVLETTEVDFLTSYYVQDGTNASVTGGIGNEHLTDFTPTIVVSIPLNADDIITVDAGISTYTSASSSNANPFDGAKSADWVTGSPWVASSGASRQDTWGSASVDYSHSSDSRNTVWNADASFATEYDYYSIGFGGGVTKLFNEKNTTVGVSAKVYLDAWSPVYPTELEAYAENNGNLTDGFFQGVTILDQNGNASGNWRPANGFTPIQDKARNSYSASFSFSQILSKNAQISLFIDVVKQQGWLGNPLQRVYFGNVPNYYIGNSASIPIYTSPNNTDVFQLADDIERLPDSRFKIPIGVRLNYFINETFALRTYYRYYFDDWGVSAHTASMEVSIKISDKFTLYPSFRYYNQTQADYFAPYEQHLSTSTYYTSDYDLSKFSANQYGFGISYTDIFTKLHISKFGLKSIDLKYANYKRNTGFEANIVSFGLKFVLD